MLGINLCNVIILMLVKVINEKKENNTINIYEYFENKIIMHLGHESTEFQISRVKSFFFGVFEPVALTQIMYRGDETTEKKIPSPFIRHSHHHYHYHHKS